MLTIDLNEIDDDKPHWLAGRSHEERMRASRERLAERAKKSLKDRVAKAIAERRAARVRAIQHDSKPA